MGLQLHDPDRDRDWPPGLGSVSIIHLFTLLLPSYGGWTYRGPRWTRLPHLKLGRPYSRGFPSLPQLLLDTALEWKNRNRIENELTEIIIWLKNRNRRCLCMQDKKTQKRKNEQDERKINTCYQAPGQ